NPRPADYKSAALPTELRQHLNKRCAILVKLGRISNLIYTFFRVFLMEYLRINQHDGKGQWLGGIFRTFVR
ncbi:MAG: hypothetical protein ACPHUD_09750, partial [Porticoccaceae bacterium]